jgi:predicted RNA polymerase sigma factor
MWAQTAAPTGEGALHAVARDVASAEDALSGAFASALADWLLNGPSFELGSVATDRSPPKDDRCRSTTP